MGKITDRIKSDFRHTRYACYLGYIVQAVVNNFPPLLFVTFHREFGIGLSSLSALIAVNFAVQLISDYLAGGLIVRFGYRTIMKAACAGALLGSIGLAFLPSLIHPAVIGLGTATALSAFGGGVIEVAVSPIVDACPKDSGRNSLTLLHGFYCWGFAAVVILSNLYFRIFGIDNWRLLACLWALLPLVCFLYFFLIPIGDIPGDAKWSMSGLIKNRLFWVFGLLMICAGAGEAAISQWISVFTETGLKIAKAAADLVGPLVFALLMGTGRTVLGMRRNLKIEKYLIFAGCAGVLGYMLAAFSSNSIIALVGCGICGVSVGTIWPCVISLAAESPLTSTAMFALLALMGDIGCILGPSVVGIAADAKEASVQYGLRYAALFPLVIAVICMIMRRRFKDSWRERLSDRY